MKKSQVVTLVIVGLVVLLGIIFGVSTKNKNTFTNTSETNNTPSVAGSDTSSFTPEIPDNAVPTAPVTEAPASQTGDAKIVFFEMTVDKNGYEPSALTVMQGNLVEIRLTALDSDYDFSMPYKGLYQFVEQGETRSINFGTKTTGTFLFGCRDYCPASGSIEGKLIVIP